MKNFIKVFLLIGVILLSACSKNGKNDNPLTTGIGGGGNVDITVGIAQDNQGTFWFGFNPSVSVKLASAVITQAQLGINQTINNPNPNEELAPLEQNSFYSFYEVPQQAQTGQQWTFRFQGTIVQGGQAFDKTVNFTVQ